MLGQIQDLVKGVQNFLSIFADSAQWGHVDEVSPNWLGPGPTLGPWKLLGFSLLNIHFQSWVTFLHYF